MIKLLIGLLIIACIAPLFIKGPDGEPIMTVDDWAINLPETVEAYALIPVGYPMGTFGPVTRLPAEDTLCWDRWG